jgi:vacuolar-type H+-ATPase subunit E/Vma4
MQIVGQAREGLVDVTLEQAKVALAGLRWERIYPDIFCRLLDETLAEMVAAIGDTGRAKVEVDPRDRVLAESMLRGLILDVTVNYTLDSWGGLTAQSEDGRITVTNHLESRLERALPYLRRYLAAWFEEGQWQTSTMATPAYAP